MTEKLKAGFAFQHSTKGAHRYAEVNGKGRILEMHEAVVGTLYIRKSALADPPRFIVITIDRAEPQ